MSALSAVLSVVSCGAVLLLVAAAWHDFALRLVPNVIPGALVAAGIPLRLADGGMVAGVALALAVFAVAVLCWRKGWMGGGDMKLLAATAIVVPPFQVGFFLFVTTQVGGVLALIYLVLSRTIKHPPSDRGVLHARNALSRILRAERWRICRGAPVPYGFAIAVGGITFLLK